MADGTGFGIFDPDTGLPITKLEGDGDAKLGNSTDDLIEVTGSLSVTGPAVFNEAGSTTGDFRIESNAAENMFFVSAQNNRIGIGTDQPIHTLDIQERTGIEAVIRLVGSADVGI
ncbi:MAG: hypothetical protein VW270_03290, partial [Candidatus Poseidoniales archaeon]